MSWWQRLGAWGVGIEAEMGRATDMPPGSAPMIVGVYVGLCLGTMDPDFGGRVRRELEAEMGAGMGLPGEALEAQIRDLIAARRGDR